MRLGRFQREHQDGGCKARNTRDQHRCKPDRNIHGAHGRTVPEEAGNLRPYNTRNAIRQEHITIVQATFLFPKKSAVADGNRAKLPPKLNPMMQAPTMSPSSDAPSL